jgi:hypothetical protein
VCEARRGFLAEKDLSHQYVRNVRHNTIQKITETTHNASNAQHQESLRNVFRFRQTNLLHTTTTTTASSQISHLRLCFVVV